MAPTYRADSLAQVIEEGVRIFGPEVTAAALLAAVAAAPVRSTTQRAAPSIASKFGHFFPSHSFRRKLWTTLVVAAFAVLAGAVVFGGGRESRDDAASLIAPVNAASSNATPVSAVEPAIAVAAPAAPEPERVIEADVAPPSKSQHATDTTATTPATDEPTGQSASALKERRKASSPERASRNDRRSVPRRVVQTQNAPAPATDPNCKVFLPDNVFMSHHDQFHCFR